jgi:hypothetical protein
MVKGAVAKAAARLDAAGYKEVAQVVREASEVARMVAAAVFVLQLQRRQP